METTHNPHDEKWSKLAKELFDQPDGGQAETEPGEWDAADLDDIRRQTRAIDYYFRARRFDPTAAWETVRDRMAVPPAAKAFRLPAMWRVAAAVVLLVVGGSALYWASSPKSPAEITRMAVAGTPALEQVNLPDGSVVTLNAGSTLHYPKAFGSRLREVELDGEAFFEVTPNPQKPFVIHAGKADIKVLGTSFNVDASPADGRVSVVVATGRVQVSARRQNNPVILVPGLRGDLDPVAGIWNQSVNLDPNYLSWKTRNFIFNKTRLKDVLHQLNKVYGVRITTADPQLETLLLTARFDNQPIGFVLEVIAMTHQLEPEKSDGNSFVLKRKQN